MSTIFLFCGPILALYGLTFVPTYISLGRINRAQRKAIKCMNEQRYRDAVIYLNKTLTIWPAPEWVFPSWKKQRSALVAQRAYCYKQLNEYDLAQADCNTAIALDPKSATAYATRGANLYAQDRLDEALMDMNTAVDLLMDNPIPRLKSIQDETLWKLWPVLNRAMVYNKLGRPELALKDYDLAKYLVPELEIVGNG